MASFSTRINLVPTSRTLASGVPFAPRLAFVHPPASHGHGHGGPRSDVPPKWAGVQGGFASNSKINCEYLELGVLRDRAGGEWLKNGFMLLRKEGRSRNFRSDDVERVCTVSKEYKTDPSAPPTGIFQQRFMSTTPARKIEAQPHVKGVPDWSAYQSSGKGENTRTLSYFMVGSLGVLAASGAKSTVSDILSNMAASADVLALAKIEVEMGSIPEGQFLRLLCIRNLAHTAQART